MLLFLIVFAFVIFPYMAAKKEVSHDPSETCPINYIPGAVKYYGRIINYMRVRQLSFLWFQRVPKMTYREHRIRHWSAISNSHSVVSMTTTQTTVMSLERIPGHLSTEVSFIGMITLFHRWPMDSTVCTSLKPSMDSSTISDRPTSSLSVLVLGSAFRCWDFPVGNCSRSTINVTETALLVVTNNVSASLNLSNAHKVIPKWVWTHRVIELNSNTKFQNPSVGIN